MLSKKIIRYLGRSVNYASFICAVPFYWDTRTNTLKVTRSKFKRLIVYCQFAVLVVFFFVVIERLILIAKGHYTYEPLLLIIASICLTTMSMPIIIAGGFQLVPDDVVYIANLILLFMKRVEVKYAIREAKKRARPDEKWTHHLEVLLKTVYYVAIIHPSFTQLFCYYLFLQPHRQILITSLVPFLEPSLPLVLFLGSGIVVIMQICWGIMLVAISASIILVFGLLLLLKEINPSTQGTFTVPKLREPAHSLFHYKCIQLIISNINSGGAYAFPPLFSIVICITVICNVTLALYGHNLSTPGILSISIVSIVTLAYQSGMYYKVGMLDKFSLAWTKSWKRCANISDQDRKFMVQHNVKACGPVSVAVGHWGHIKTITSLKIVGKIIFYTGKILLTLRKVVSH